jgi:deferrochelatase/peroxidase EfeB
MSHDHAPRPSRRGLLAAAGGLAAAVGAGFTARSAVPQAAAAKPGATEAFWGDHQAGIVSQAQTHTYFAAFDLTTENRDAVVALLQSWTAAAARMTAGQLTAPAEANAYAAAPAEANGYAAARSAPAADPQASGAPAANVQASNAPASNAPAPNAPASTALASTAPASPAAASNPPASDGYDTASDASVPTVDSSETLGIGAARLTITFGFGAGLFERDGKDRYGLASRRPEALVDLPRFNGDQLVPERTGGDLSVQACADDPLVAFHAVRQLARLAFGVAQVRWAQTGFMSRPPDGATPRNLMGFKDGTQTPQDVDKVVWVADDGPAWMRGGSYMVVRRIRMALEHWDRTNVGFQEQTFGREKLSGAPLGLKDEFAPLGLDRTDKDENPVIAENAHVRLANATTNDGAEVLRRGYSYNDGVDFTAERWPPWRQGMEYDAGLLFVCYQRDPRTGFIKIFEKMAKFDMLNQFVTHTGGGLFACPGGAREGEFIGQRLFDQA